MIRPQVLGPTGTVICDPVLTTSCPRVRPSVASMAMVRTVFSHRCCATSRTSVLAPFFVSSAVRIDGSSPGKITSTTAPMTWLIEPLAVLAAAALGAAFLRVLVAAAVAMFRSLSSKSSSECFGTRDNLDKFGGDRGLAAAVVLDGQLVDQIAGIARGIVHRGHRRALFTRLAFDQRAEQLRLDIAR